jgi:tetratricopeptide (TPR) repeat protein
MKHIGILFAVVLLATGVEVCVGANDGGKQKSEVKVFDVELYPVKQTFSEDLRLLPDPNELQANAVDLYEKALSALPKRADYKIIDSLLNKPIKDLPVRQAEHALKQYQPAIKLAAHAGRCKKCKWPVIEPTNPPMEPLDKYKVLARVISLQARAQIVQGRYKQALGTLQTGMAMARNLGQTSSIVEGLVGIATGAVMCSEVRELIQQADTPSLYGALNTLPEPFIDLNKQINAETENAKKQYKNPIVRNTMLNHLKPAHNKCKLIAQRLGRDIAILKCVEAIRLYAASHGGKLPASLADITEVPIPDDPLTGKAFDYKVSGSKATLESTPTAETKEYALRYNLDLKKHK